MVQGLKTDARRETDIVFEVEGGNLIKFKIHHNLSTSESIDDLVIEYREEKRLLSLKGGNKPVYSASDFAKFLQKKGLSAWCETAFNRRKQRIDKKFKLRRQL